jgi:hypothetical protein
MLVGVNIPDLSALKTGNAGAWMRRLAALAHGFFAVGEA